MPCLTKQVLLACLSGVLSAGCAVTNVVADEQHQLLSYNGSERSYLIRVPGNLPKNGKRVPLVIVLHGGGGNAENAERMTGFTAKAEQAKFIVVYPNGTGRFKNKLLTWNAGHCCAYAMKHHADDVGFINALIDKLVQEYPVDSRRIYATGMSNGGMMTHRLGIELADRFAAIAPVVATVFGDEVVPSQPVSAIMLNGLLDKSVPNQGGPPGGRFKEEWDGTPAQPAMAQAAYWAKVNKCDQPEQQDHGTYITSMYHCPTGRAVSLYVIKNNGHAWPGGQSGSRHGDKPDAAVNGTDVIWEFFKAHPK